MMTSPTHGMPTVGNSTGVSGNDIVTRTATWWAHNDTDKETAVGRATLRSRPPPPGCRDTSVGPNIARSRTKHICKQCGKTFKRAHNLKIHGRLHNGDRPYGCPFPECEKEFRWKSSIVSHINWHRTKRGDVLPGEVQIVARKMTPDATVAAMATATATATGTAATTSAMASVANSKTPVKEECVQVKMNVNEIDVGENVKMLDETVRPMGFDSKCRYLYERAISGVKLEDIDALAAAETAVEAVVHATLGFEECDVDLGDEATVSFDGGYSSGSGGGSRSSSNGNGKYDMLVQELVEAGLDLACASGRGYESYCGDVGDWDGMAVTPTTTGSCDGSLELNGDGLDAEAEAKGWTTGGTGHDGWNCDMSVEAIPSPELDDLIAGTR